jgi:hypothetical protein
MHLEHHQMLLIFSIFAVGWLCQTHVAAHLAGAAATHVTLGTSKKTFFDGGVDHVILWPPAPLFLYQLNVVVSSNAFT